MQQMHVRAAAVLIGIALGLGAGCAKRTEAPKPVPVVPPAAGAIGLPVSGRPAITPANGPITDVQVREYVLSHRIARTLQATNVAVRSIRFMTAQQVRAALHGSDAGVPPQTPLCLVVMTGRFVFAGPRGITPTFPIGVEVFDARTGNLLEAGGLPSAPRPAANR